MAVGKFDRVAPPASGDLDKRLRQIESDLRAARSARRLEASTIGKGGLTVQGGGIDVTDGGGIAIKNGGALTSFYDSGRYSTRIGTFDTIGMDTQPANVTGLELSADADWSGVGINGQQLFVKAYRDNSTGESAVHVNADQVSIWNDFGDITLARHGSRQQVALLDTGEILLRPDANVSGATVRIEGPTTSSAANAFIEPTSGGVYRVSSSLRYKRDVEAAEIDADAVLSLEPRTWRDRAEVERDPETDRRHVGFIAEELDEAGLSEFVVYDEDGRPDAIEYDRLTAGLLTVVKRQQAQIEEQGKALEDLSARIDRLARRGV
jgi:hypothetical protein